jgi:hypothetical protein
MELKVTSGIWAGESALSLARGQKKDDVVELLLLHKRTEQVEALESQLEKAEARNLSDVDGDGNDDESDLHLGHEWVQGYDKNHGHYYYFNVKTKESRWDAPEEYLPHVESSEEEEESD